jgi:hypothetical protein
MQTGERGRSEKSEGRRDNGKRKEGCRLEKGWEKEKRDGRKRKIRGQETRYGECRLKKGEGRHEIREGGCR